MRHAALGVIVFLAWAVLAAPVAAEGQEQEKLYRIGWLLNRWPTDPGGMKVIEAFRQGLQDHGYVEGETVTIEFRSAELELDRLPALAAELVRLRIDVLVAAGNRALLALKGATTTIPIVMLASGDPVATGLVASLARPGGNVTRIPTTSCSDRRRRPRLSGWE